MRVLLSRRWFSQLIGITVVLGLGVGIGVGIGVTVFAQRGDQPRPSDAFQAPTHSTTYVHPRLTPTLSPNELQKVPPPPSDAIQLPPRITRYEQPPLTPTISPDELQRKRTEARQQRKALTLGSTLGLCDGTEVQLPPDTWVHSTRIALVNYAADFPFETIPCPFDRIGTSKSYVLARDNSFAYFHWYGTDIEPCLAPGEETSFDWLYERLGLDKAPGTRPELCPKPENVP